MKTFTGMGGLFALVMASGVVAAEAPAASVERPPFQFRPGADVAQAIATRYSDTRVNCGKDSMPAFLCSGIILRATVTSKQYEFWDPSPTAQAVGGVSFSYMRKDFNLLRLAHRLNHGYILKPILDALVEKYHMQVLCFFPIDGTSNDRSESGCGPSPSYPEDSKPCGSQGIQSADDYVSHYMKNEGSYPWRCAFNVRDSENNKAGPAFYQGLLGGAKIMNSKPAMTIPSDLKIATWDKDIPKELPIEALFYIEDAKGTGREDAQYDQQRFYAFTGVELPIIYIEFPKAADGTASFKYFPSDQAVAFPYPPEAIRQR